MKSITAIFVILFLSPWGSADWFAPNLSLEDKIKLTRQIREQMTRNAPPHETQSQDRHGRKTANYSRSPTISAKDHHNIKMILSLPLENRIQALSNYKANIFFILKQLAFSNKEKMPIQWKALISLARLYPEQSHPLVLKALRSSTWFLRNAGLIAMEIINSKESIRWAGRFLNDPALIVRTAAVGIIKKHKATQYKIQLLQKLNAPDSFHKNQSLWIRHHIVSTLADFCEPGEEKRFISFLQDPDETLHPFAITALEKLTGKTFPYSVNDEKKTVVETQKNKWINWWSKSRNNSAPARNNSAQL